MVFKEAFEHYKAGNATPEEIAYIEEELGKSQLIAEYLEADFVVNLAAEETPDQVLKNVKRSIRKRSRNIIAISVSIVFVLVLLANYVVVPLLNNLYYNPMTKAYDDYTYDIDLSLVAYTELHHAGYYYNNTIIEKTGIGRYAMTLSQYDMTKGMQEYLTASMDKDHLTMPFSFKANIVSANIFARASYPVYDLDSEPKERFIAELKALPDYMSVTAAVSFSEDLTMDQLIGIESDSEASFLWAGIRNAPENIQQYPLCGMELSGSGLIYEHINDKYPAFELAKCVNNGKYSASDYENHFTSLLQYTVDHTDFVKALDHNSAAYYQSILDYVRNNGVKTYGVLVTGSASDVMALLDSGVVSQIWPCNAEVRF